MSSVFDNVLKAMAADNLRREILDLQMVLSVAGNTPVGEANPIDWDETTKEIEAKRQRLAEIFGDAKAVDIFLTLENH